jgi:hypothetical protein
VLYHVDAVRTVISGAAGAIIEEKPANPAAND